MDTDKNESKTKIDLTNPEFNTVFDLLEKTNQSVFLTGKAGTGKSTLLRHITGTTKKKYVVLAPTGIAAVNVGGQTLHSFFRIPTKPLLPDDPDFAPGRLRSFLKYSKTHISLIRSLELIIIDEISMVRADVIDFIDKILRIYSGNMRVPFGGKQLLFVGDVFQLEPVVTGNDRDVLSHAYNSFYFFDAKVFNNIDLVPIELSKVYRQSDERFIRLLDNIRMGIPTQHDLDLLNSRLQPNEVNSVDESQGEFTMTIATRRDLVDSINDSHLQALPSPSVFFEGLIEGDFPATSLPTDLKLELKTGAQVVFIKNDPERRWVNGTLAVVETCLPDEITVRTEDGEVHKVDVERWNNVKYVYNEKTRQVDTIELGSFMQYPLKPAWALTIHKSQGLTFSKVRIDMGRGAFAGGQTYVALSRSRSLEGITMINPISPRDIYIKANIARFAHTFNSDALIESALIRGRSDALFHSASLNFEKGNYAEAVQLFAEGLALRPDIVSRPEIKRLIALKSLRLKAMQSRIEELQGRIGEDKRRFSEIAQGYVDAANDLWNDGAEGWQIEAVLAQFDKALRISPGYTPALLGRAEVLLKSGLSVDDAYNAYRDLSMSDDAEAWRGYVGMAEIAEAQSDPFEAANFYMNAHDVAPHVELPLERLAKLYDDLGDKSMSQFYKTKLRQLRRKKKRDSC